MTYCECALLLASLLVWRYCLGEASLEAYKTAAGFAGKAVLLWRFKDGRMGGDTWKRPLFTHNIQHSKPKTPARTLHEGKQLTMRCIRFILLISDTSAQNYNKRHVPSSILASTLFLVPIATFIAEWLKYSYRMVKSKYSVLSSTWRDVTISKI